MKLWKPNELTGATPLNSKSPKQSWYIDGLLYGFPSCCVDAMALDFENIPKDSVFEGSGFRPCAKCKEKPVEEMIAEINRRRRFKIPFIWREALPGEVSDDKVIVYFSIAQNKRMVRNRRIPIKVWRRKTARIEQRFEKGRKSLAAAWDLKAIRF